MYILKENENLIAIKYNSLDEAIERLSHIGNMLFKNLPEGYRCVELNVTEYTSKENKRAKVVFKIERV